MIEVARAVLTAGEIAGAAQFFSVDTNDLSNGMVVVPPR